MKIISIREKPAYKEKGITFLQKSWPSVRPIIYEDCVSHSIGARNPLPQWYLLEKDILDINYGKSISKFITLLE